MPSDRLVILLKCLQPASAVKTAMVGALPALTVALTVAPHQKKISALQATVAAKPDLLAFGSMSLRQPRHCPRHR